LALASRFELYCGLDIFVREARVFLQDSRRSVAGFVEIPDGERWDSRAGERVGIVHNVPIANDLADLLGLAFPKPFCGLTHLACYRFERDIENSLCIAARLGWNPG